MPKRRRAAAVQGAAQIVRSSLRPQELFGRRIGKPQSLSRKPEAIFLEAAPALLLQPVQFSRPFLAQVEAGRLAELLERPAGIHAQTKRRRLARARQRRQLLGPFNGAPALLELLAVKERARPVLGPHAAHAAGGARSQAVIAATTP